MRSSHPSRPAVASGFRWPAWVAGLLATLLVAATVQAQAPDRAALEVVPHRVKPAFPSLQLRDAVSRGQRALELLGGRLPEVAAFYGQSPDEFRSRMLNDRSMRLDRNGRVFLVDEIDRPLPASTAVGPTDLQDGTLAPVDQTFLLHSKPGAQRTIYLNFRGATLSGTAWNGSRGPITALPFDLDSIPYTFSVTELQRIQAIWQRVAEDYAAFDVDVTTEAPPPDALTRSSQADTVFGTTVLITSNVGVFDCSCGGVAYLGVFDDTSNFYKPALVFYNQLGSGNEKYVAEAISHEAGHNMGLAHDGNNLGGYYGGHGSGATGWAPIMGVGYSKALVQWSKGEYLNANNVQDDYLVMQGNGLPLRADDHGNTIATATALAGGVAGGVGNWSAQGIIERPSDVDMFRFTAGAGAATVSVSPSARAPNLDALLTLRNAAGTVLATANPVEALNASVNVVLPAAGTYYVSVQGTGKGDPKAEGYSNYGSLGRYAVNVTALSVQNQAPTAAISASTLRGTAPLSVSFDGSGSRDADGSITSYAWSFSDGPSASGASTSRSFATAGSYTAVLTVTDNGGLSGQASVTVTVDPQVVVPSLRVADIAMSLLVNSSGASRASASVKVVDRNGAAVPGAVVSGTWSGLVSRAGQGTTGSTGVAILNSAPTNAASGSFVFTVTGITLAGYTYTPAANTETSDSIQR